MQKKRNFPILEVKNFQFIPGKFNPVDLATGKEGKLEEIGMKSEGQSKKFLKLKRLKWPLSREIWIPKPPLMKMKSGKLVWSQ